MDEDKDRKAKELFESGWIIKDVQKECGISNYRARQIREAALGKVPRNSEPIAKPTDAPTVDALYKLLLKRGAEGISFEEMKQFPGDAVAILGARGHVVDLRNGNVVLDRNPSAVVRNDVFENLFLPGRKSYKICVITDPHLGGTQAQIQFLLTIFAEARARGCSGILNVGDHVDGTPKMHRGFEFELALLSCDAQVDAAAWTYSQAGIPMVGVSGNHCGSWQKESGIDTGRLIQERSGGAYTDLGPIAGWIAGPTGDPNFIRLFHPNGGSSYALSYKDQKLMEYLSVGEEDCPTGLHFTGHYHKFNHMRGPKGSHFFLAPAACRQTKFMQALSLANHAGALFIEFTIDGRGRIDRCIVEDVRLCPEDMVKREDYSMVPKRKSKTYTANVWGN